MKLTVLVDNNTYIDRYYLGEPALSFYIEDGDSRILFDTGYSDIYIRNAMAMNINLSEITHIALSHGHNDHTGGLRFFREHFINHPIEIIAHPHIFKERFENDLSIGIPVTSELLAQTCKLTLSQKPVQITPHITFLGEIPTYYEFEQRKAIGYFTENSYQHPDYVSDDSALVYNTGKGLFIITGCSHSGICNIIEHAKNICNEDKIVGVIGGFHLLDISEQLYDTIVFFEKNNIRALYPCHCVSFAAKAEIHKRIPIKEVGVNMTLNI